jgi:O-antigen ligase
MFARVRAGDLAIFAVAIAAAAAWPVTVWTGRPLLLPALVAAVALLVAVVREPAVGIAVAAALTPLGTIVVDHRRPFLLAQLAIVGGLFAYGIAHRRSSAGSLPPIAYAAVAFAAVSVASAALALDPSESLADVVWTVTGIALLLAALLTCRTRSQALIAVAGVLVALLLGAVHGLVQLRTGIEVTEISFVAESGVVTRIMGGFGHPNQFAGFLAMLIPVAGALAVTRSASPGLRALAAAAALAALPALVASYTRGAVIGLVVGTILWLGLLRPRAAITLAVITIVVAVLAAPPALRERFTATSGGDVTLRQDIWRSALDIYSKRPVLGVGPSNFGTAYAQLPSSPSSGGQRHLLHTTQLLLPPHAQSEYLNALAELGLVGALVFGLLGLTALVTAYRGSRLRDPVARSIGIGAGAGIAAIGVQGLLDVTLFQERVEFPLLVLVAAVATLVALERGGGAPGSRS